MFILRIRSLTESEIALIKAGLELLTIQGQSTTQAFAKTALEQKMAEHLLRITD